MFLCLLPLVRAVDAFGKWPEVESDIVRCWLDDAFGRWGGCGGASRGGCGSGTSGWEVRAEFLTRNKKFCVLGKQINCTATNAPQTPLYQLFRRKKSFMYWVKSLTWTFLKYFWVIASNMCSWRLYNILITCQKESFSKDIFAYRSPNSVFCCTSQDDRSHKIFRCPLARQLRWHSDAVGPGSNWAAPKDDSKEMVIRACRIIRYIESICNTNRFLIPWSNPPGDMAKINSYLARIQQGQQWITYFRFILLTLRHPNLPNTSLRGFFNDLGSELEL